jgi:hypothetical protein
MKFAHSIASTVSFAIFTARMCSCCKNVRKLNFKTGEGSRSNSAIPGDYLVIRIQDKKIKARSTMNQGDSALLIAVGSFLDFFPLLFRDFLIQVKPSVDAAGSNQFIMGSLFFNAVFGQHQYQIRGADCGKPVGDDQRCFSLSERCQCLLNQSFAFVIQ